MISVIALAHNRDKNLEFTMKCWAQQTYKDFELNVFESGNMDSTIDILKKYQDRVKINCWRLHTKYVNKTYAINFLAEQSKGEFLSIWDVDILKADTYLDDCLKLITTDNFVQQYARYINDHFTKEVFSHNLCFKRINDLDSKHSKSFSRADAPSQIFVRKEDFVAIGMYDLRFLGWAPEDSDFVERLLRYGKKQTIVEPWSYHLEHSLKNNYQHTAFSSKAANQRIYLENKENKIIVVDNSNVDWSENQWDPLAKPVRIL